MRERQAEGGKISAFRRNVYKVVMIIMRIMITTIIIMILIMTNIQMMMLIILRLTGRSVGSVLAQMCSAFPSFNHQHHHHDLHHHVLA